MIIQLESGNYLAEEKKEEISKAILEIFRTNKSTVEEAKYILEELKYTLLSNSIIK